MFISFVIHENHRLFEGNKTICWLFLFVQVYLHRLLHSILFLSEPAIWWFLRTCKKQYKLKQISSVFRICIFFLNGMSKINPKLPYSTINTLVSTEKPSFRRLLKKNNVDFCFYLSLTALWTVQRNVGFLDWLIGPFPVYFGGPFPVYFGSPGRR